MFVSITPQQQYTQEYDQPACPECINVAQNKRHLKAIAQIMYKVDLANYCYLRTYSTEEAPALVKDIKKRDYVALGFAGADIEATVSRQDYARICSLPSLCFG